MCVAVGSRSGCNGQSYLGYPKGLPQNIAPPQLDWRRLQVRTISDDVPEWLESGGDAPLEEMLDVETRLEHEAPELARLLDYLICAAAIEDHQRRAHVQPNDNSENENDAERIGAVESLMQAVAQQTGRTVEEIAAPFAPRLAARQPCAGSPEECAANSEALAFLYAQLTGH